MMRKVDNKSHSSFLLDSFSENCERYSKKKLYLSQSNKNEFDYLNGKMLCEKVKLISGVLLQKLSPREKAIIILPQGLDYICALLSCFHANVTAIPTSIIDIEQRGLIKEVIDPILEDSGATCILTNSYFAKYIKKIKFSNPLTTVNIQYKHQKVTWQKKSEQILPDDVALLLYTSGSTSRRPKGVMLSHANIASQASTGVKQWGIDHESRIVSWMPQFHNFGLHFNILAPLLMGATSIILTPDCFVKNPKRWFEIISKYKATHTAAPNFALDYCCSMIDKNAMQENTLKSLKRIICGGEPIHKLTCDSFEEKFKNYGFKNSIICPHYGMSETGSVVTIKPGSKPRFISLDVSKSGNRIVKHKDQSKKSKIVASCGKIENSDEVLVVNTEKLEPCSSNEIGEIWVKSDSVAMGYMNKSSETNQILFAALKTQKARGYFRTGDIGLIDKNHLYIVGREKEVIIVNGKNYYPIDIEWTIKKYVPDLKLPISVVSFDIKGHEKIVVVQEVEAGIADETFKKLVKMILAAVSESHGLEVYEINFVEKNKIPRSSSGKILRRLCRNLHIEQKIKVLYRYQNKVTSASSENIKFFSDKDIETNVILKKEVFANILNVMPEKLEGLSSFSELGLNSIQYVRISKKIEEIFEVEFAPVMLFKYRSFIQLSQYLTEHIKSKNSKNANDLDTKIKISNKHTKKKNQEIAIIGMSCDFPGGSTDLSAYWYNIVNQKDCIIPIPEKRAQILRDSKGTYESSTASFPQWGGFIEDVDKFDASFFGIIPVEAECMDPQQRKLLELTWALIESAGYNPRRLSGESVGVFVGVHNSDYSEIISKLPSLTEKYGAYLDSGLHISLIANRVSRWFNYHGISEVINTACSSSIVALHHAVESIHRRESSLAIAAGINLLLSSRVYDASNKAGMLSEDGRCKTFDKSAEGFVRSEGYGALLLKPYKEAKKDRDIIHGIIKDIRINHDGRSNSLRAPNLGAQKKLIKKVYQKSEVRPETIGYIEVHGTGTPLGDPIEVQALKEAFNEIHPNLQEKNCGLGSVKTNIGHCESAAGIAGLIKVLLSMKNRTIPGILHYKCMNPYISLEKSPFYIAARNQKWKRLVNDNGLKVPLRAGVSSFGFGGTNAHVVIEEYIEDKNPTKLVKKAPVIIVLSAKGKKQLVEQATRLYEYIIKESVHIDSIAYTLQVGRAAMENRVAFVAYDIEDLKKKLNAFIKNNHKMKGLFQGFVSKANSIIKEMLPDEKVQKSIKAWKAGREDTKIPELWVKGLHIDWDQLYGQKKPRRIMLPTYPFAKDRYWVDINTSTMKLTGKRSKFSINSSKLNFTNISTIYEQKYRFHLSKDDYFIYGHKVRGKKILPGAAILEMARVAADYAGELRVSDIQNVVWSSPVIFADNIVDLQLNLIPREDKLEFKVLYACRNCDQDQRRLNYKNSESLATGEIKLPSIERNDKKTFLEIEEIKNRCEDEVDIENLYRQYILQGLDYDKEFRLSKKIFVNKNECIVHILSRESTNMTSDPTLHPCVLDCVLHSTAGAFLKRTTGKDLVPYVPHSLSQIKILGRIEGEIYAYGKIKDNSNNFKRFDILVTNKTGRILLEIRDLILRPYKKFVLNKNEEKQGILLYSKTWVESPLKNIDNNKEIHNILIFDKTEESYRQLIKSQSAILVLPGKKYQNTEGSIFKIRPGVEKDFAKLIDTIAEQHRSIKNIIYAWSSNNVGDRMNADIDDSLKMGIYSLICLTKALITKKIRGAIKLIYLYRLNNKKADPLDSAVGGFVKTARKENQNMIFKTIGVSDQDTVLTLVKIVNDELSIENNNEFEIIYHDACRIVKKIQKIRSETQKPNSLPLKERGIYLITGGMGGIGVIIAQYLAKKYRAKMIITGRSTLDMSGCLMLEKIKAISSDVIYMKSDVTKKNQVEELHKLAMESFGGIDGVIHCAGIIRDAIILNKNIDIIKQVLSPKIDGTINLHQIIGKENPDIFVLFSSISAEMGQIGQADYAYANSFMDNYAMNSKDVFAINWPLWDNGGMAKDRNSIGDTIQVASMIPISDDEGLSVFNIALMLKESSIMAISGDTNTLLSNIDLHNFYKKDHIKSEVIKKTERHKNLNDEALRYLQNLFSQETQIPLDTISADKSFDSYGIDSVMALKLVNRLEKDFGRLSKTLFYEYQTVSELKKYFIDNYYAKLSKAIYRGSQTISEMDNRYILNGELSSNFTSKKNRFEKKKYVRKIESSATIQSKDIAIIGICGRYPMAENLEELWRNLKKGKDCITDIPPDRYEHMGYDVSGSSIKDRDHLKWGGFIKDVDKFDPLFFNISPKEAIKIDPQERLFLQVVWHAMEDAGYTRRDMNKSKVGVFVGVMWGQYQNFGIEETLMGNPTSLSSSFASIANRVSYTLNLHGPSLAVDTMCSSSLTAVHLSCESIIRGECDMAFAGGVNLILHSDKYLALRLGEFDSSDGKCRSFGEGGDGYVPGEGVGAVLLKHLDNAVADGDNIYAIIKGSSINHGGRTNGYTVPNPNAQEKLIVKAFKTAGISPESISYVEAHGTGTSLGDPIEIKGLSYAFKKGHERKQSCAVGSIKSNIGHLEAAAGIAGLTKVLLQMKHKQLVPSLHSERLNPYIDFANTPFYVQQNLSPWDKITDKGNDHFPRRAGVSAFGAGGSNAHVVVEDYDEKHDLISMKERNTERLFLLSAVDSEQLKDYAHSLIYYLKDNLKHENIILDDLSYTLQVGREPMSERLAMVFSSGEELIMKLTAFCDGQSQINNLFVGNVKNRTSVPMLLFNDDQASNAFVREITVNKELTKLAALWVNGIEIDWELFYKDRKLKRISLPGYPFCKERYWALRGRNAFNKVESGITTKKLHLLIDENISDFYQQKFVTKLRGNEFFLTDHKIDGQKYMPGSVYLEIARASIEISGLEAVAKLKDIVWKSPLIVDTAKEIYINLYLLDKGPAFEFYTLHNDLKVVHASGRAVCKDKTELLIPEDIEIVKIKNRCNNNLSKVECYELFKEHNIDYGPGFRTIKTLWHNDNEAMAQIELPSENYNFDDLLLHPSLTDGAFQAAIGLMKKDWDVIVLPFSVGEIEIYYPIEKSCYVHVVPSDRKNFEQYDYNLDICDRSGRMLLRIKNFILKASVELPTNCDDIGKCSTPKLLYYTKYWETVKEPKIIQDKIVRNELLLVDFDDILFRSIKDKYFYKDYRIALMCISDAFLVRDGERFDINYEIKEDYTRCIKAVIDSGITPQYIVFNCTSARKHTDIHSYARNMLHSAFYLANALISNELSKIRWLFVFHENNNDIFDSKEAFYRSLIGSLDGFGKSLKLEQPGYMIKNLRVFGNGNFARIVERELKVYDYAEVMYDNSKRLARRARPLEIGEKGIKIREDGIYIIAGGTGGLGMVFTEYILQKVRAKVILIGRSKLTKEKSDRIKDLERTYNANIIYEVADISDMQQTKNTISQIKINHGKINGFIHSAGAIRDSFIQNKSADTIEEVLNPKIYGVYNFDEALSEEQLDFFVTFSSLSSVLGSTGQTDYAVANRFLEDYVMYQNERLDRSNLHGRSIVINWPLWDEVGMSINDKEKEYMWEHSGTVPIPKEKAIEAFEAAITMNERQVIITFGREDVLNESMDRGEADIPKKIKNGKQTIAPSQSIDKKKIKKEIINFLKKLLSDELGVPPEKIGQKDTFDKYGLDSVMIMSLNKHLSYEIKNLSQSLLYQYSTLDELAKYFIRNHYDWSINKCRKNNMKREHVPPISSKQIAKANPKNMRFIPSAKSGESTKNHDQMNDIAIIGISGRYPEADNLDEFWENIKMGRDCIIEIPRQRWNVNEFYSSDKSRYGKSYGKWGGILRDVDKFDPLFFNISPHEADMMDPQERLFLEESWHVIENACYKITDLSREKVGVFVGAMWGFYQLLGLEENLKGNYVYPNSSFSSIANRVSYSLNLQGPSVAVDTMCSSSITAIHLAIGSIIKGECNYAIAGGVNISQHPYKYLALSDSSFISTDGKCRSFGKNGDGYVPGEGVGALLLKPLHKALADKDYIYGVIKSTAVNHNGRTAGYTVPNPNAQARLITDAYQKGGIQPETISYIEAHGSGTGLGDPIEIAGLNLSIGAKLKGKRSCPIGSVKSNIGHLESAAGIAGITKVLLQMKYKHLVPSLHSTELNNNIDFNNIPFKVQQKYEAWKRPMLYYNDGIKEYPRRAGVSSFGAGGTNAHIILEEYDNSDREIKDKNKFAHIIVLSAKNSTQLKKYVRRILQFLENIKENESFSGLSSIAYSLQVGREEMQERLAVVVSSENELLDKLKLYCAGREKITKLYRGIVKQDSKKYELLLDDEEWDEFIEKLIYKGNAAKIAQLWTIGATIPWRFLYGTDIPNRVPIPGYPFSREKHWVDRITFKKNMVCADTHVESKNQNDTNKESTNKQSTELQGLIMEKVSSLLKIDAKLVNNCTELGEIGFNSIFALRMLNQLNLRYRVQITPADLKLNPKLTIGEMIGTIAMLIGRSTEIVQKSDNNTISLCKWKGSDNPQEHLFPKVVNLSSSLKNINILLTGATGVLGGRLLKDLLEMTHSKIYCLVRAKNTDEAKRRLKKMLNVHDTENGLSKLFKNRVIPVVGDIKESRLRMGDQLYNRLTDKIDMIIHSAAKLSLTGLYDEVRPTNVEGTANMIDFALNTKQKYLIFISTHGVMGDRWFRGCTPFTENDLNLEQGFDNLGYQQSKFESEILVRIAQKKGLKWNIIRAGNIMGDSQRGRYPLGITNVTGIYYSIFKTAIDTGLAPDTPLYFDITPLDYVGKGIVYLGVFRKTIYETYHVTNPSFKKLPEVYAMLKDYGYDISIVDCHQYLKMVQQKSESMDEDTSVLLELFRFNPIFRKQVKKSSFADNVYTRKILERAEIKCHELNRDLVKTYLKYCIKSGYLKAAGNL